MELVPPALQVLRDHLDAKGPDAWRAALKIVEHAYGTPGRADALPPIPDQVEDLELLSTAQLLVLAGGEAAD